MAIITKIDNVASVSFGGSPINSNSVTTLLQLAPTITKAVNKLLASIGDELTYTITITNIGLTAITNLPFSDLLDSGVQFIPGSFTVNGSVAVPTVTANLLTYTIPSIPSLGTAVVVYKVTIIGGVI